MMTSSGSATSTGAFVLGELGDPGRCQRRGGRGADPSPVAAGSRQGAQPLALARQGSGRRRRPACWSRATASSTGCPGCPGSPPARWSPSWRSIDDRIRPGSATAAPTRSCSCRPTRPPSRAVSCWRGASSATRERLRDRIERLDQNLRTIRNVERAKGILVATKGMTEDAAYRFLRKQAMERRTTVNAVAAAVINSFELLG